MKITYMMITIFILSCTTNSPSFAINKIESNEEKRLQELEQKIKSLENLIFTLTQSQGLQQELIKLLQKQIGATILIDEDEHEDEHTTYHDHNEEDDHRFTLRIPKSLMAKIDIKRKQRVGKISRNLWILETLDEATRK